MLKPRRERVHPLMRTLGEGRHVDFRFVGGVLGLPVGAIVGALAFAAVMGLALFGRMITGPFDYSGKSTLFVVFSVATALLYAGALGVFLRRAWTPAMLNLRRGARRAREDVLLQCLARLEPRLYSPDDLELKHTSTGWLLRATLAARTELVMELKESEHALELHVVVRTLGRGQRLPSELWPRWLHPLLSARPEILETPERLEVRGVVLASSRDDRLECASTTDDSARLEDDPALSVAEILDALLLALGGRSEQRPVQVLGVEDVHEAAGCVALRASDPYVDQPATTSVADFEVACLPRRVVSPSPRASGLSGVSRLVEAVVFLGLAGGLGAMMVEGIAQMASEDGVRLVLRLLGGIWLGFPLGFGLSTGKLQVQLGAPLTLRRRQRIPLCLRGSVLAFEPGAPGVDLAEPFRLEVSLEEMNDVARRLGCVLVGMELKQMRGGRALRLRWNVVAKLHRELKELRHFRTTAPVCSAEDFSTHLWPALEHHASLHDNDLGWRLEEEVR